jgi:hypothetical protein
MKPYIETKNGNVIKRTFSESVDNSELVWHRDKKDRIVKVLSENDWMIQFDNELPIKMNINEEYYIPKESFHRVIKGNGELVVEITETDFVEEGKKDACYRKVRSRYSVWPSAYASGALVKCRKVGAANWGNKSEGVEPVEEKWSEKYKKSIDCNNPKGFSQKAHCQGRKKTNESIDSEETKELIKMAHNAITRRKGKEYAPNVHEIQAWIDDYLKKKNELKEDKLGGIEHLDDEQNFNVTEFLPYIDLLTKVEEDWGEDSDLYNSLLNAYLDRPLNLKRIISVLKNYDVYDDYISLVNLNEDISEAKKTDFSKEKSQGLHGWFARKGGGGSRGWVDCNTCKKDPETGRKKCKPCGRKEGEKRSYPACRPTPSACGTRGKGKKWGKKSNENLEFLENLSIFENKNYIKDMLRETFRQDDVETKPVTKPKPEVAPSVVPEPSRKNKPFLPKPSTTPKPKAEK